MHEVTTCEEVLKLAHCIEIDDDDQSIISPIDKRLKDKVEKLHNFLLKLILLKNNL